MGVVPKLMFKYQAGMSGYRRFSMDNRRNTTDNTESRVGRTKWMVNNSKEENLTKLMQMVPERTTSVPDMILPKLGEKNMSVEVMSELAGFNRATGYKIINGKQRAERDILLRIAFVLGFDYKETAQCTMRCCRYQWRSKNIFHRSLSEEIQRIRML